MHSNSHKFINIDDVKTHVENDLNQSFKWFYSQSTGSTNSDLLRYKRPFSIAISESQQHGRGQGSNTWQSGTADNLLFSIAINVAPSPKLALMPIRVGIAIKSVLNLHEFIDITLKWPNDIFYKNKKVGGVLIESTTQDKHVLMVIGVGINVNMPYLKTDSFIALKQQQTINRTPLLIDCLKAIFIDVTQNSLSIIDTFNNAHLFNQKNIQFKHKHGVSNGICQGINDLGQLLIHTSKGLETHSTGSIIMDKYAVS